MSRSPPRTLAEPSACEVIVWCASKASMMAYFSILSDAAIKAVPVVSDGDEFPLRAEIPGSRLLPMTVLVENSR